MRVYQNNAVRKMRSSFRNKTSIATDSLYGVYDMGCSSNTQPLHTAVYLSSLAIYPARARRSVVIGLKYNQSTKQWSYHWCTVMLLLQIFKSVSFSQYVQRNGPSGLIVLQTNQLIAVKPNMTGKSRSVWVIYLECVIKNGMRRNSRHKRFTKSFVLGYKN